MRFDQQIFLEIPGYLIVNLGCNKWGIVHDGKLLAGDFESEEEAKQRAGNSYIRIALAHSVDQYLGRAVYEAVRDYVDHPHLPDFDPNALAADLRTAIIDFVESELAPLVLKTESTAREVREERKKQQAEKAKTCTDGP